MRRPFSILMFQTVARAKDQCQLARNETQVWCRSVSKEKSNIFWRSDSLRIFSYLFCCCLLLLAFRYEFLFNQLFPLFFPQYVFMRLETSIEREFHEFHNFNLFFLFALQTAVHWIVKVLEIRYYYKMPDLFRTCPC